MSGCVGYGCVGYGCVGYGCIGIQLMDEWPARNEWVEMDENDGMKRKE